MSDTPKWDAKRGPRVGDWCVLLNGNWHRIGQVEGDSVKLADSSGSFFLDTEGDVYYSSGGYLNPPIPKSSLREKSKREPGAVLREPNSVSDNVQCRVFREV